MKYQHNFFKFFIFLFLLIPTITYAQDWKIGILAKRGAMHTHATWQPWIDALNKTFAPKNHFSLVTLDLNDLAKRQAQGVDFILTNQSQFFYLNNKEVRWLATLKSTNQKPSMNGIGSAIFVRKNSPFYKLKDLENKTISAVGENAFGGFLLGYNEFYKQGLIENKNLHIKFTGFPVDNTLLLLKEKKVDGAIVPTCIFESLVNEHVIKKENYRLLAGKNNENQQHCLTSTTLLPNWSLAVMPQVPSALAAKLVSYLLTQKSPNLPQWIPPYSTAQADKLMRQLYHHPKQDFWHATKHLIIKYQNWIIVIISLLVLNYLWVTIQIHRKTKALQQAYEDMRQYEQQLVQADRLTILGEMSAGIAHEVNQPLAAMRMYIEGLKYSLTQDTKDANINTIHILDKVLQQIDRSSNIIYQLMHWAKGKKEKEQKEIHLKTLVQQVYNFISLQNKHKYQLRLICTEKLYLTLKPTVLEQVICNCLLNAIQAHAKIIQVIVKENNENILIYIVDNGTGFKTSELSFPFVPFRSSKNNGLGLGLVLCQRLMRSIDGDITLHNRQDQQGAEVILTIPNKYKK